LSLIEPEYMSTNRGRRS